MRAGGIPERTSRNAWLVSQFWQYAQ